MDLFIFKRDTPRHPWRLAKRVALPQQKSLEPVSYRTPPGAGCSDEIWMVEAESEGAARARLEADLVKAN